MRIDYRFLLYFILFWLIIWLFLHTFIKFDIVFVGLIATLSYSVLFISNFRLKIALSLALLVILTVYFFTNKKIYYSSGPVADGMDRIVINRYQCDCNGLGYVLVYIGGSKPGCFGGQLSNCHQVITPQTNHSTSIKSFFD